MEILGDRKFVEVPGGKTHELPPLLVNAARKVKRLDRVMSMAGEIIESEEMLAHADLPVPDLELSRRRMDLAVNLVEQYLTLVAHWRWGDSVLEWIRQCEITFDSRTELRNLLRPDVWPHAGRCSFVKLLEDKEIDTDGVPIEQAVGLRLAFRQPPPMSIVSDQYLFYLGPKMSTTAYADWSQLSPPPVCSLPPERFNVEVVHMCVQ